MDSVTIENKIKIDIADTVSNPPKKNEVLYNPDMALSRSLVLCALAAYEESGLCLNKSIRCLDAFGATGIAGLQWAFRCPKVQVTINDTNLLGQNKISKNAQLNDINIEVTGEDINVLLFQRQFDFIFLDCYGASVQYLDAAFKNIPKNGMLIITSTDDTALYGKVADVTLRNYGGYIVKTFYAKELAARLILASIVRSAAKYNKGIVVVSCVAIKSNITVMVRVVRGPTPATECVHKVRRLIHCCICEDRTFYPQTIYPIEQPYSLLSCSCRSKSSGKVAVELGPVWSGEIFDPVFCGAMLQFANSMSLSNRLITLLQTILGEAVCARGSSNSCTNKIGKENTIELDEPRSSKEDLSVGNKKFKTDEFSQVLPFYFNLHRHSPKGYDLEKLNKIVEHLRGAGHRSSRTHFDPEAIRTSATLTEFNSLLLAYFKATQS